MKVQISSKFEMNWLSGYKSVFEKNGWSVDITNEPIYKKGTDLYMLMWLDQESVRFINSTHVKKMVFIRRYEFFSGLIETTYWDKVSSVVVLNNYFAAMFENRTDDKAVIIPNGVVLDDWKFKKRTHGSKLAMVGYINPRKNIPMALQILVCLPEHYTLHIAGGVQSAETDIYLHYLANFMHISDRVKFYDKVDDIDSWLEDKNYFLNTSISEGCPNSVIEAMAKGIMPIVHNWPGSFSLFTPYVFNTVGGAVNMILNHEYDSQRYRDDVQNKFSEKPYREVFNIAKGIVNA